MSVLCCCFSVPPSPRCLPPPTHRDCACCFACACVCLSCVVCAPPCSGVHENVLGLRYFDMALQRTSGEWVGGWAAGWVLRVPARLPGLSTRFSARFSQLSSAVELCSAVLLGPPTALHSPAHAYPPLNTLTLCLSLPAVQPSSTLWATPTPSCAPATAPATLACSNTSQPPWWQSATWWRGQTGGWFEGWGWVRGCMGGWHVWLLVFNFHFMSCRICMPRQCTGTRPPQSHPAECRLLPAPPRCPACRPQLQWPRAAFDTKRRAAASAALLQSWMLGMSPAVHATTSSHRWAGGDRGHWAGSGCLLCRMACIERDAGHQSTHPKKGMCGSCR